MEMVPKYAAKRNARHGLWSCFCAANQKRVSAEEVMVTIKGAGKVISREEDNGVTRVRIVMSKKELKQMVATINSDDAGSSSAAGHRRMASSASTGHSLEQSLHVLRRRHMKRVQSMSGRQGGWTPALQSIPEEV